MGLAMRGRIGCPSCDGAGYVSFNWGAAKQGTGGPLGRHAEPSLKYVRHLRRECALKFGSLYYCPTCGAKWYLDRSEQNMSCVPGDQLPVLMEWSRRKLVVPDEVVAVAREIGATPPDLYGNGAWYVRVPCEVVTKAGESIPMAMLSFQDTPQSPMSDDGIRFADEIARIAPSEFAVPKEVRLATSQAPEIRMMFAPTHVKAPDGRSFILNWTVDLFSEAGVKGSELILVDGRIPAEPPVIGQRPVTCFIADWFPGVEALRIGGARADQQAPRPPIAWTGVKRLEPGKPVRLGE